MKTITTEGKKSLSLLLIFAIIIGLLPPMTMPVWAEEGTPPDNHTVTMSVYGASITADTLNPIAGENNLITLKVKDSDGNADTTFSGTTDLTITGVEAAPKGSYGRLNGTDLTADAEADPGQTISVTFNEGQATANLSLHKAGNQTITFHIAGVTEPATKSFDIQPAAPATMTLTTDIQAPAEYGGQFAWQPVITLQDAYGNRCTNDNTTQVTASVKDTGDWTLTGITTITAANGRAAFTNLGAASIVEIEKAQIAFNITNSASRTMESNMALLNASALPQVFTSAVTLQPWVSTLGEGVYIVQIAAGKDHSLALTNKGVIYAWGDGRLGQLGNGSTDEKETPVKVSDGEGWNQDFINEGVDAIAAGNDHSLALKDGVIYAWGNGSSGQLGDSISTLHTTGSNFKTTPFKVLDGDMGNINIKAIAAGDHYSLALNNDGVVFGWGDALDGQLGNGRVDTQVHTRPIQVVDNAEEGFINKDVKAIAAGASHTLALNKDGVVYAWGLGLDHQLGQGNEGYTVKTGNPMKVLNGVADLSQDFENSGVDAIAAGDFHSLALKDGVVYAWGRGSYGRLGFQFTDDNMYQLEGTPVKVDDGEMVNTGVTEIVAGVDHSLALKGTTIYGWGRGTAYQLGDGSDLTRNTPIEVSAGHMVENIGVTAMTAGEYHSLAIKDGQVYAWGSGIPQLGLGGSHVHNAKTPARVVQHADWGTTITIADIPGVTPPELGATRVTTITETTQYTGPVTWSPAHNPFQAGTVYTATITLTPKNGYTLNGVLANFFKVAGATATHAADTGVVSAVFPEIAIDTTAPILTEVNASRASATSGTVTFNSNAEGTYYYNIGSPVVNTTTNGTTCTTSDTTISLTTLTTEATDIYIVVKDEAGNVSSNTFKITVPAFVPQLVASVTQNGKTTEYDTFAAAWVSVASPLSTALDEANRATVKLFKDVNDDNLPQNWQNSTLGFPMIVDGKFITIDLNGYDIDRGLTAPVTSGHIIQITKEGSLTIKDSSSADVTRQGHITGGKSTDGAGAIELMSGNTQSPRANNILKIEGGNITGNQGFNAGAISLLGGTFTMTGGSITHNEAVRDGGGIYISGSDFHMSGGIISDNESGRNGGGVMMGTHTATQKFIMTGGSLTGNRAGDDGGGVYVYGTFSLGGDVHIADNVVTSNGTDKASNVSLPRTFSDHFRLFTHPDITVTAPLNVQAPIGVNIGGNINGDGTITGVFTTGYNSAYPDVDPTTFFTADNPDVKVQRAANGEAELRLKSTGAGARVTQNGTSRDWGTFLEAWEAASTATSEANRATITLLGDVTSISDPQTVWPLQVDGKFITIDLNGFDIDRGLTEPKTNAGYMFHIRAGSNVTIQDTSTTGQGKITGGYNRGLGGVIYLSNANLTMTGGNITGNKVTGGTGEGDGGAIYITNGSVFTMSGGSITNNEASRSGGGISLGGGCTFTMTGGRITGNKAGGSGGVRLNDNSTFNVKNAVNITGNRNTSGKLDNIFLGNSLFITVTGPLNGAEIGVYKGYGAGLGTGTITTGYKGHNPTLDPTTIFIADSSPDIKVQQASNGEAQLVAGDAPDQSTYTVVYHSNDGTDRVVSKTFPAGTSITIENNPFTRTGYTFTGWNVAPDGTSMAVAPGLNVTLLGGTTNHLYAQWQQTGPVPPVTPTTYTVVYDANGGTGNAPTSQTTNVGTATTVAANTFTRTGYTFTGWNTGKSGTGITYAPGAILPGRSAGETITLFAQWTENTYSVSGTVNDHENNPANGASVKLMKGNTQIGTSVTTASDGTFTITDVPNGTYNLVVNKDGIIVTTLITVSGSDYATGIITLPSGKTNSVVEVKPDTPSIVVGGLDGQFTNDDKDIAAAGGTVEITFTAQKKAENDAQNANDIKATASNNGKKVGIFLDLTVTKTVTGHVYNSTTQLIELQNPIVVLIPLDEADQNKSDYVVYRYHGTSVDTITTTENADGEKIELIDNGKTIKLTIKKFSTYAIAYTVPVTPPSGTTPGDSDNSNDNRDNDKDSDPDEKELDNGNIIIKNTPGGTIEESPDSTDTGTEKTFLITPDEGYVIADILVDGKSVGAAKTYTFKNLTKEVEIKAVFVKETAIPYHNETRDKDIFIGYTRVKDGIMTYIAPQGVTVLFKDNPKYFNDISRHAAIKEIDFVAERNLFVGTAPNVFSPEMSFTRAMFVTVIGKLHGASFGEITESTHRPFTDVAQDSWYNKYVTWAEENNIVRGVGSGKFEPERAMTRQEMTVIMDKYLTFIKVDLPAFELPASEEVVTFIDQTNIAQWAAASVQAMQQIGMVETMAEEPFNPKGNVTRAQAVTWIYRLIHRVMD